MRQSGGSAGIRRWGFAGALLLVCSVGVQADELAGQASGWTLSMMGHYLDDDPDRNASNGLGGHIGIGTGFIGGRHAWELAAQYTKLEGTTSNAGLTQWSGTIDYRYKIGNSPYFKPYALLSAGFIANRFKKEEDLKNQYGLAAAAGLGVVAPINSRLAVRTELRYRLDRSDQEKQYGDWILSAGFEFAFTKRRQPVLDDDRDGIANDLDRCGDTPPGSTVDQFGCAKTADTDGDGVPDARDMCGGTPEGAEVDRYGCMTATPSPSARIGNPNPPPSLLGFRSP